MSLDSPQDSPQAPRDELEARLTALLLGELSPEEEGSLRAALAQDAALAQLHDRLARTIGLVREAAGSLNEESAPPAEPLKLSSERREKLLESFKIVRPKELTKRRTVNWRELAALAAMLMGLLVVVVVLNMESRETVAVASSTTSTEAEAASSGFGGWLSARQRERQFGRAQKIQISGQPGIPQQMVSGHQAPKPDQLSVIADAGLSVSAPSPVPAPVTPPTHSVTVTDGRVVYNPVDAFSESLSFTPTAPVVESFETAAQSQPQARLWAKTAGAKASGGEGGQIAANANMKWGLAQPKPAASSHASQIALPNLGGDSPQQTSAEGPVTTLTKKTPDDFFDTPAQQAHGSGFQSTTLDLNRNAGIDGMGAGGFGGAAGGRPERQIAGIGDLSGPAENASASGVLDGGRRGGGGGGAGSRGSLSRRPNSVVSRAANGSGVETKPAGLPGDSGLAWFGNMPSPQDKNAEQAGRSLLRSDTSADYSLPAQVAVPMPALAPSVAQPASPTSGPMAAEGLGAGTTFGRGATAKGGLPLDGASLNNNYAFGVMATNSVAAIQDFDSSRFSVSQENQPGLAQLETRGFYSLGMIGAPQLNTPIDAFRKESGAPQKDTDGDGLNRFDVGAAAGRLGGDGNTVDEMRVQLGAHFQDQAASLQVESKLAEKQDAKSRRDLKELGDLSLRENLWDDKRAPESPESQRRSYAIALPQAEQESLGEKPLRIAPVIISEKMYNSPEKAGKPLEELIKRTRSEVVGQPGPSRQEELRQKLDSIRLKDLSADSLPLRASR